MTYCADFSLYDFDYHAKPEGLTIGWLEDGFDTSTDRLSSSSTPSGRKSEGAGPT
ncbi:hypothetical protein [Streptomyces sp. NPDC096324]|uniref:hypothetical protein n=1 Tax=Streptomyces sp. NPDC096324 TaxID=3366085 RepID=UPI0037FA9FC5